MAVDYAKEAGVSSTMTAAEKEAFNLGVSACLRGNPAYANPYLPGTCRWLERREFENGWKWAAEGMRHG